MRILPPPTAPNIPVWDDHPWQPLPALEGEVDADVCVVGLGGSGLTCVEELRSLGARVVGVDAGAVAGGAAGRNGGLLLAGMAPFYHQAVAALGRERASQIYRLTLSEMDRIRATAPEAVRRTGSLRIAASPEELEDCEAQRRAMRADGLPVEPYRGEHGEGLLFPADGAFNPLQRCRILARRVMRAGAVLYERSPAVHIAGGAVTTPSGRVRCGRVVVAVDGGLERLLPELRDRVRTARLQMLATAPATDVRVARPVYFRYGMEYWQQLPDGSLALGGFRDGGGAGEWTADPDPTGPVQKLLERFLRTVVGTAAPVTHRWAASVGFSRGALPVLDEVRPAVWAIGGYSGTGNVMGALCGRAAAQLALLGHSALALLAGD